MNQLQVSTYSVRAGRQSYTCLFVRGVSLARSEPASYFCRLSKRSRLRFQYRRNPTARLPTLRLARFAEAAERPLVRELRPNLGEALLRHASTDPRARPAASN